MASILMNEMLSQAQTSVQSMAGHVESMIAERRSMRQLVKTLRQSLAASSKDSRPSSDLSDSLVAVHTSIEQLTASSSSMLQVNHYRRQRVNMTLQLHL